MDFPIFHLDFLNNRWLIGIIAVLHALINHSLAVGLIPVVVMLQIKGLKESTNQILSESWNNLAYKIMKTAFIITTTIGAMTGVGIWFSASLVNPASIASLIRVFFGAWFVEWMVFVTEVVLILLYFLTWKHFHTGRLFDKIRHLKIGISLAVFSWITMAIIVAILSFMMDTGNWNTNRTFVYGFLNPLYVPQLLFRTTLAMTMGGMVAMFLTMIYTKKDDAIRPLALKTLSKWMLVFAPLTGFGAWLYYYIIPKSLVGNMPVAMGTMEFESWYSQIIIVVAIAIGLVAITANWAYFMPKSLPKSLAGVSLILTFWLMGHFERLREFIRKPYVIGEYMYSNGLRAEEYDLLQKDGVLKHANFSPVREINANNTITAGREVFLLTCSRCHTTAYGINAITDKFGKMYGYDKKWDSDAMKGYIQNMHKARYFMPPFPGNEQELDALVAYIQKLKEYPEPLRGAQDGLGFPKETASSIYETQNVVKK